MLADTNQPDPLAMSRLAPRWRTRIAFTLLIGGISATTACSPGAPAQPAPRPVASAPAPSQPPNSPATLLVPVTTPTPTGRSQVSTSAVPKPPPSTTVAPPTVTIPGKPLAGKVIAVDPGHNGGNAAAPGVINQIIWNGRENETCDTTGTETDAGYTEAQFNFNVAEYLAADLEAEGATVVLTRTSNTGVGPCVTERAAIGNNAHADAAISIHADGGPPTGRGFAVLEPVADGPNDGIITASDALALDIRTAFLTGTGEPVSSYDGANGLQPRNDLAGLNLSTVPKVLIECANMRNPTDAALLTTEQWQQSAARALAAGLTAFLT
jgi:N-acetylmuramoyl-L-alanine amidase